MQVTLNRVAEWVETRGSSLSVEKTKTIHFTRQTSQHEAPELALGNTVVQTAEEVKFLGFIFDRKLTWVLHIRDLKMRCPKALDLMKCVSS